MNKIRDHKEYSQDDISKLALHDPIVCTFYTLHLRGKITFETALILMVVKLHEVKTEQEKYLLAAAGYPPHVHTIAASVQRLRDLTNGETEV